ncbi:MAG TPA: sugar ABC transporter permease [Clostridiales bacterium]|nr:sugar ABC transporter permease [Clostridiales bacterium]HOL91062.1 sugar ABC transporter permease [Clostridiales bacterium]HPP34971.1 sugar ABC transporter permease [Clostridiales bacterium]
MSAVVEKVSQPVQGKTATFKSRFENLKKQVIKHKVSYLFVAPFGIIFLVFTIIPVVVSMGLSFTYFNILETPKFISWQNYIRLFLGDDVFLKAVKNTFLLAAITGPVGYLASLMFAWFINELPPKIRAFMVLIFYAPSISGNVYMIWQVMFSSDAYGYVNSTLIKLGIITEPILWLQDPRYVMPVILIVVLWMSLGTGFLSFVAGLQSIDRAQYEAGIVDGVKNRWQELWYITLPNMKPMLMFGAVMSITSSFAVSDVTIALAGMPSVDYAAHTVVNHLIDYGTIRFEMGYASAIATVLFLTMIICNKVVQNLLKKVGR